MKRKRLFGPICLLGLVGAFGLSSCSFFSDPDNGVTIKEVKTTPQANGDWVIEIFYENENKPTASFTIPAAVSIDKVDPQPVKNSKDINLVITTTDGKTSSFLVKAGVSVEKITFEEDEESGDLLLAIHYSDGTVQKDPDLRIPKGKDGKPGEDGKGVSCILSEYLESGDPRLHIFVGYFRDEEGNVVAVEPDQVAYDEETQEWIAAGEYKFDGEVYSDTVLPRGIGIDKEQTVLEFVKDGENKGDYQVTIFFTDGQSTKLSLPRPAYFWTHEGNPTEANFDFDFDGVPLKAGDMYFDSRLEHGQCYWRYDGSSWQKQFSLTEQDYETYTVVFDANSSDLEGADIRVIDGNHQSIGFEYLNFTVGRGRTAYDNRRSIPVPFDAKGIYTFGGWYASSEFGITQAPNPTMGAFTDLTPVWGNMTLYAYWYAHFKTIKLDVCGGSQGERSKDVVLGLAWPDITYLPVKQGYDLVGYFDAPDGGNQYFEFDETHTKLVYMQPGAIATEDKVPDILYAQYTPHNTDIIFDSQGGSSVAKVSATYGEAMPDLPTIPAKAGLDFAGFFSGTGVNAVQYYDGEGHSVRAWDVDVEATTLYARWTGEDYSVMLDQTIGSGGDVGVAAKYGAPLPNLISLPVAEGYIFKGYVLLDEYESVIATYYDETGKALSVWDLESDATLTAVWEID